MPRRQLLKSVVFMPMKSCERLVNAIEGPRYLCR
jgi:hypothetical protein